MLVKDDPDQQVVYYQVGWFSAWDWNSLNQVVRCGRLGLVLVPLLK